MSKKTYAVKKVLPLSTIHSIGPGSSDQSGGVSFLYDYEKVKTFQRSCTCINCGLEATEIRLEYIRNCIHPVYRHTHLNVYGYTHKGREVMFTVDHAVLKSLGGADSTENYNTMCERCNRWRGNKFENLQDFLDKYKNVSTEDFWEHVEKQEEYSRQQRLAKNIAKTEKWRSKIKKFYAEESMHHHVGEYNRHMKKLYKEQQKKELTGQK